MRLASGSLFLIAQKALHGNPHPDWVAIGNGYKSGTNRFAVSQLQDGWMVGVLDPDAVAPPSGPLLVTNTEPEAYVIAKPLTWVASEQGLELLLDNLRESSPGVHRS